MSVGRKTGFDRLHAQSLLPEPGKTGCGDIPMHVHVKMALGFLDALVFKSMGDILARQDITIISKLPSSNG